MMQNQSNIFQHLLIYGIDVNQIYPSSIYLFFRYTMRKKTEEDHEIFHLLVCLSMVYPIINLMNRIVFCCESS